MATKRPDRVLLFIEGTSDDSNGDLRQGFERLLKHDLVGKMPRIFFGNGQKQTIDEYKNTDVKLGDHRFLLIDLDGEDRNNQLKINTLSSNLVFFMVQEMEAWFLSQPLILTNFYKKELKIPAKNASDISEPDKLLKKLTKDSKRGSYHKVNHAVQLLGQLDLTQLKKDFPDVKSLIEKIKSI